MKHRVVSLGFLTFLFVGLVVIFTGGLPAHAATFTVSLTTDAGDISAGDGVCDSDGGTLGDQCTLRAAIQEANALAGADVISVPVGTYPLSLGTLTILSDTLISGVLSTTTIVDGSGNSGNGVFLVSVSSITPTVTISNLTIRNGLYGFDGGGVNNNGGNVTLSNTRVISNVTYFSGGGIANFGTMTVTGSSILSNTADLGGDYGGGIYNTGTLTLINSEVSNNAQFDPAAGGGGIYNTASGTLIITNTAIMSNTAAYNGGGIYNFGALVMAGSSVLSNTSSSYGGGLFTPGAATIASSTFRNNLAVASGGIYAISSLNITNTTIISNTGQDSAGGLSTVSVATITNSSILDNVAGISGTLKSGGGISFSGVLNLTGSVVKGNRTTNYGGGIYAASSGSLVISGTTISNNSAITPTDALGGGIFNNSIPMTLTNSTVSGNTSSGEGGGIYHYNAALNLVNTTVSGNTANGSGGGINFFNPSPVNTPTATLNNVTITNNKADNDGNSSGDGGGFFNFGYGMVKVKNSILAGNLGPSTSPDGYNTFNSPFNSLGYNLIGVITGTDGFTATGDITNTAPLLGPLQNNGGPTFTHALLPGSPAKSGGNPVGCTDNLGNPLTTDQRGMPRPVGPRCDIGAFEYVMYIFMPLIRR